MDQIPPDEGGLLAPAKRILRALSEFGQNRVELFLLELREERIRFFDALLLATACVVCALMTLALFTFALVVIFWEHRAIVLIILTLLYGVAATVSFFKLRKRLQEWQSFEATLDQIKKDRECFQKPS